MFTETVESKKRFSDNPGHNILELYNVLAQVRFIKSYLDKVHSNSDQSNPESDKTRFYKLSYIKKNSEQVLSSL